MNPVPCMYAIVRFAPFVDTGEFANVGIILMAPTARYFGYNLMGKRHGRVTRFFCANQSETVPRHAGDTWRRARWQA